MKNNLIHFTNVIFAAFCLLTFFTTIASGQWVSSGLTGRGVGTIVSSGTNLYVGTDTGIFLSSNGGAAWVDISGNLPRMFITSILVNGTDLFIGTGPDQYTNMNGDTGAVFHSTNNGVSWVRTNLVKGDVNGLLMNGTNLFAGVDGTTGTTKGGVYVSTDNGATWTIRNNGLLSTKPRISGFTKIGSTLYVGSDNGVSLSTDNGSTWTTSGLTSFYVSSFAVSGGNLFAGTYGHGVYILPSGSSTWKQASAPMLGGAYIQGLAVSGTNIFATSGSGSASGLFISTDMGTNWSDINTGLPANGAAGVGPIAASSTTLFAGPSAGGIWKRPLSDFSSSGVNSNTLAKATIELSPNPTKGIVYLRSSSENELHISVSNLLGKILLTKTARGSDQSVDLTDMPAGVYFVRVITGGTLISKMVIRQ